MKRFFEERFLPGICYPTEAAQWRAFGRLPWPISFNGEDESREDFNDGTPVADLDYGYSFRELVACGIVIDQERYQEAGYITLPETPPSEEFADYYREEVAEVEWRASVDRKMDAILEAHKAAVFEALASGRIAASGYHIAKQIEEGKAEWPDARREDVPRDAWTMKGYDWDACKLTLHDGSVFRCVVVDMVRVLDLWPEPALEAKEQTVTVFAGATIVIDEAQASQRSSVLQASARRGAPPKGDNLSVKTVVSNLFRERAANVADGEKEALVAEVMDFAQRACGHVVARSTVQGWLKPLYPPMPEIMPGNHAGKDA